MIPRDEKWPWIGFLGSQISAGANARKVLLGWIGSAAVAIAVSSWTFVGVMESVPSTVVQASVLGTAFAGFLLARASSALYPGGFCGLVDEVVGTDGDIELEPGPLLDFVLENIALLRTRVLSLSLFDLIPTGLLVVLTVSPGALPVGAATLLWALVFARLTVFLFYVSFMSIFLSKPARLRSYAEQAERSLSILEEHPQLARIALKLLLLGRLGSISVNLLYYGGQVAIAAWIVTTLTDSVFSTARLVLLAGVVAVLGAIAWELWKRAKGLAPYVASLGDLQHDLVTDQVKPTEMAEEFRETSKQIRLERAVPYRIPDSIWKALGETPPRNSA